MEAKIIESVGLLWTGGKVKPRHTLWQIYGTLISIDEIKEENYGVLCDHDGIVWPNLLCSTTQLKIFPSPSDGFWELLTWGSEERAAKIMRPACSSWQHLNNIGDYMLLWLWMVFQSGEQRCEAWT